MVQMVRSGWRGSAIVITVAAVAAALTGPALAGTAQAGSAATAKGPDTAGVITTVAGGVGGPGAATSVPLAVYGSGPCGVSTGPAPLYIADGVVRRVDGSTGQLTTVAGTFGSAPAGTGGPAAVAAVNSCGTVKDHDGNLIVTSDPITEGNDTSVPALVEVVAGSTGMFYGQAMTKGDIYSVAGGGTSGLGDGGPALDAELTGPQGLAIDTSGNLIVADTTDQRIRVMAVTSGTFYGQAMTADDIYTVAGNGTAGFSGDGGPATAAALDNPVGVGVNGNGGLVVADEGNQRVRLVAESAGTAYGQTVTAGNIYTVAGTPDTTGTPCCEGYQATAAQLISPAAITTDQAGNTLFTEGTLYPTKAPCTRRRRP
jgi:trimeric autotransporter adhesin